MVDFFSDHVFLSFLLSCNKEQHGGEKTSIALEQLALKCDDHEYLCHKGARIKCSHRF